MDRPRHASISPTQTPHTEDDGLVRVWRRLVQAFVPAHDRAAVLDRLSTHQ